MKKTTQHSRAHRDLLHQPPSSGQRPKPVTRRDRVTAVKEMTDYHHGLERFFRRREQSDWSWFYVCGQLSNLERKTIEPMVLSLRGAIPNAIRDLQRFMSQSVWDTRRPIVQLQAWVAAWLGDRDGVAIVDGSGFPKQGKHSIGVAPQYCGHLGKIANCQQGVFLAYASRRGIVFWMNACTFHRNGLEPIIVNDVKPVVCLPEFIFRRNPNWPWACCRN